MEPEIERVNSYKDSRFSPVILRQHGAFLVNGVPCQVEIAGPQEAVVCGEAREFYPQLIEDFRFYAEHICRFFDKEGALLAEFPAVNRFPVKLQDLQPSQFFVDQEKLAAVETFITGSKDIVIPVVESCGRLVSLDGHTRLAAAVKQGVDMVFAFFTGGGDYVENFVEEARNRGVFSPYDLPIIPHSEYEVKWNRFCDEFFANCRQEEAGE